MLLVRASDPYSTTHGHIGMTHKGLSNAVDTVVCAFVRNHDIKLLLFFLSPHICERVTYSGVRYRKCYAGEAHSVCSYNVRQTKPCASCSVLPLFIAMNCRLYLIQTARKVCILPDSAADDRHPKCQGNFRLPIVPH